MFDIRIGGHMVRSTNVRSDARMVHIRVDPEVHRRLRIVVAAEDTSIQEWLARVVESAVDNAWPTLASGERRK